MNTRIYYVKFAWREVGIGWPFKGHTEPIFFTGVVSRKSSRALKRGKGRGGNLETGNTIRIARSRGDGGICLTFPCEPR